MATNINGLSAAMTDGATWLSGTAATPTAANVPIVLDTQLRGSLRTVSGVGTDTLTQIPESMLEDGMLVFVSTQYTETNPDGSQGPVRTADTYYQFNASQARDAFGRIPNRVQDWAELQFGGGAGQGGFVAVANTLGLNNLMTGQNNTAQLAQPNDGELFFITDATNLDGQTQNPPANSPAPVNAAGAVTAITNLPAQAPQGGYTNAQNAIVAFQWNNGGGAQRWVFQRVMAANAEGAYVNVIGDTMTGNLVMDDDAQGNDIGIHFTADNRGGPGNPAIAFADAGNNFDTGIYQGAVDEIDFAIAGADVLEINVEDPGLGTQTTLVEVPNTLIVDTPEVVLPIGVGANNTGPSAELIFMGTDNATPRNIRTIEIEAPINNAGLTADYTLTLPTTAGAVNQFLQTDGAGVLTWAAAAERVEAYTAITNAWNLDNDLMVEITATGQTVPIPTNQRNGQTGLLLLNRASTAGWTVTWPAAGGNVFQYAGGAIPNITQFPAIIPYTVIQDGTAGNNRNDGVILWGTPTVNIT